MAMLRENNQIPGHENSVTDLIPGLPDDLAMLCLVRVARKYHHILRRVSKKWRSFIASRRFVSLRQKLGLSEGWVYVLSRDRAEYLHWDVLDPSERMWMALPAMPPTCLRRFGMACEVLDGQLYFIGGRETSENTTTNEVHVFDAFQQRWKELAQMDVARCHFASGALDGNVYAIGGQGQTWHALMSWEIFDAHANQWLSYHDPSIVKDPGESLVMDGKIYVRHISDPRYAARYDPISKIWAQIDDEMTRRWNGPAVVLGEDTYMLDHTLSQIFGIKLLALDKARKCWDPVGKISRLLITSPCKMAVVGSTLFVVGRGLNVLAIDMKDTLKSTGILVTSLIMGAQSRENNYVVCCKTIYI